MELSPDQAAALDNVMRWFERGAPMLTLGGYAGTGKTTLISHLLRRGPWSTVRVCAFTGKAAYVLCQKDVPATTIHRLIYTPTLRCNASLEWAVDCHTCVAESGEKIECPDVSVGFPRVPEIDADLVVVDESSMISTEIFEDLMSFGVPVLFVGDHGQLEPVGDDPRLMVNPDVRLETIHRQAAESPIIGFAHHVRLGNPPRSFGAAARRVETDRTPPDVHTYDAVLCGKNSIRVAVNAKVRSRRGFSGPLPAPGERVICLKNDYEHGIYNGMQATVVACQESRRGAVRLTVRDDLDQVYPDMKIDVRQLGAEKKIKKPRDETTLWDFGYCLTVHKSQGSEWKRVCVLEWIHPNWSAARWRYTAATRASEELLYCVNPAHSSR